MYLLFHLNNCILINDLICVWLYYFMYRLENKCGIFFRQRIYLDINLKN